MNSIFKGIRPLDYGLAALATAEAKDRVLAFQRASAPLVDWLHEHVGQR